MSANWCHISIYLVDKVTGRKKYRTSNAEVEEQIELLNRANTCPYFIKRIGWFHGLINAFISTEKNVNVLKQDIEQSTNKDVKCVNCVMYEYIRSPSL